MRIAMIGSRGIPARSGGVERVVEELSRELAARGHEVLVYCRPWYAKESRAGSAGAGLPEVSSNAPGARVRKILTWGVTGKNLDTISHTLTASLDVRRRDVDVVHIHSPGPALWSGLAGRGRPVVLTVHAPDWLRQKWSPLGKAMLRMGLRSGMKRAAAVTAVSRSLAQELTQRFGREVEYVPNAAAPASPAPMNELRRHGLEADRFGLYVGRIVPEKRVHLLMDVWEKTNAIRIPLVVIGKLEGDYGRFCRAKKISKIVLLGEQYGSIVAEAYGNAAICIQPSVLEGMSMVLLEAARYGRCVLAADIPPNRDCFGDAVCYFAADNTTELGEEIVRLLGDTALRLRFGERARSLAESHGTWPEAAARYERIYRQAVERER